MASESDFISSYFYRAGRSAEPQLLSNIPLALCATFHEHHRIDIYFVWYIDIYFVYYILYMVPFWYYKEYQIKPWRNLEKPKAIGDIETPERNKQKP